MRVGTRAGCAQAGRGIPVCAHANGRERCAASGGRPRRLRKSAAEPQCGTMNVMGCSGRSATAQPHVCWWAGGPWRSQVRGDSGLAIVRWESGAQGRPLGSGSINAPGEVREGWTGHNAVHSVRCRRWYRSARATESCSMRNCADPLSDSSDSAQADEQPLKRGVRSSRLPMRRAASAKGGAAVDKDGEQWLEQHEVLLRAANCGPQAQSREARQRPFRWAGTRLRLTVGCAQRRRLGSGSITAPCRSGLVSAELAQGTLQSCHRP